MRSLDSEFLTDEFQEQLQVNYVTRNAHIHNINVTVTKDICLKFILSRKDSTLNYLCWKYTHGTQPVVYQHLPPTFL